MRTLSAMRILMAAVALAVGAVLFAFDDVAATAGCVLLAYVLLFSRLVRPAPHTFARTVDERRAHAGSRRLG